MAFERLGRLSVLAAAAMRAHSLATAAGATLPTDCIGLASSLYALSPPPQLVAYVTGGGIQLAPWLLATPGASRSVLELTVPYAHAALTSVLGRQPERS